MRRILIAAIAAVVLAGSAQAGDIIEEWANVKAPAALPLKPATVDAKTTALLLLDFVKPNCTNRPRCLAEMPAMKKLLGEARAHKVAVIYSTAGKATAKDILPDVAPSGDEPVVHASVDKFQGTNLAHRHGRARRRPLYGQRGGTARDERDRAGRRHVVGGPLL